MPEDCEIMVKAADLYKDGKKVKSFKHTLSSLGKFGQGNYLKIPDIDMRNFTVPKGSGVAGSGPEAVSELARKKYGNNPFSQYTTRIANPKFYARVGEVDLKSTLAATPQNIPEINRMKNYLGKYTVIQYFFFYIFNDFWNKHVGDWDSTIEVLIKKETNQKLVFYSTHETMWLMNFNQENPDLNKWIKDWKENKSGKKGPNNIYAIRNHPFGFVSNGGHGIYPTPGFTMWGAKLPGDDLIGATDERVIGYTCIIPEEISEKDLKETLKRSKPSIDDSNVKFLKWDRFELFGNQAWLNYKGLWGEDTNRYRGWDGPEGPTRKERYMIDSDIFYEKLKNALSYGYKEQNIFKGIILRNHHVLS